jgi:hypothetical protein
MVSRRAALVLACLFGFRLLAVSGALVCTAHGSHAHLAESGHHSDGPSQQEDGKQTPCNSTDSADCCAAMVSCSLVLASGTVVATSSTPPDDAGEIRQLSSSPVARPHSPDPPPPKS